MKSKSGMSALAGMAAVAGGAVLLLVAVLVLRGIGGGRYEALPVEAFAESPRNYSGNRYEYEGRIERQLGFEEGVGRVILTESVAGGAPVPLYVSAEREGFSPNPGQVYRFSLRVDGDGILNVEAYEKL